MSEGMSDAVRDFEDLARSLRRDERPSPERAPDARRPVERLIDHWYDANPNTFTKAERGATTLFLGGLSAAHDELAEGALRGMGYKVEALATPDTEALRFGKEFGNRGQCNPTYFTVGNLIKRLVELEKSGVSRADIVKNYAFFTAGSCGPCRFGMYLTEYRKALRDAGFEGFRVLIFREDGGISQTSGQESGLEFSPAFFITIVKALLIGDVLNIVGYRIRPYETTPGATDTALAACKAIVHDALAQRTSLRRALKSCRARLEQVEVSRAQPKPKVSIIGEFWAMTTEGDGNYHLQRFLEREGAEVHIQPIMSWLLYLLWECRWDTQRRMQMQGEARAAVLKGGARKRLATLWAAEKALRGLFGYYGRLVGLKNYKLDDMDEIATISHQYYDNHLRGGEGHMEVGKLIASATRRTAHMVVSVKPFGCMPSSAISDGVQSLVTERHPDAIFCAIETTGDAAANAQSRVQLSLFKAHRAAREEYRAALAAAGTTEEKFAERLQRARAGGPLAYPSTAGVAGTAARLARELAGIGR